MNDKSTVFVKILPKQTVYKVENGESSSVPLRLGRLDKELYRNQKVINTLYGENSFIPKIEVQTNINTDDNANIVINISNYETRTMVKQLIIRTQVNNMDLSKLKIIYDEIINILNSNSNTEVIELIELIRNKEIQIEEYC